MISRKYIYAAVFGLIGLFTASCSQDDSLAKPVSVNTASASFSVNLPIEKGSTRGVDASVQRYAIAIEGVNLIADNTKWKVSDEGNQEMKIQDDGNFVIEGLVNGQQYTAHFWADYNAPNAESPTYDITWYSDVQMKAWDDSNNGYFPAAMAYCGSVTFTAGASSAATAVTLKHAVAEVILKQSVEVTPTAEQKIIASCTAPVHYNIKTQMPIASTTDWNTNGTIVAIKICSANTLVAAGEFLSFYMFAPAEVTSNVTFYFAKDDDWDIIYQSRGFEAPIQANHKTNITGNFLP